MNLESAIIKVTSSTGRGTMVRRRCLGAFLRNCVAAQTSGHMQCATSHYMHHNIQSPYLSYICFHVHCYLSQHPVWGWSCQHVQQEKLPTTANQRRADIIGMPFHQASRPQTTWLMSTDIRVHAQHCRMAVLCSIHDQHGPMPG